MRLLWILPLLLAACAKTSSNEGAHSLVHEIKVETLKQALLMSEEANLKCADPTACAKGVGLLVATSPTAVFTCTAFLIGEDLLATNSHCLPSAVKALPDLCAERVKVIFAANGVEAEERISCGELLGSSARPNAVSPDLALLRLAHKSTRPPFAFNNSGVDPGAAFTTHKVNPLGTGASAELISQTCSPAPNSYRFPLYKTSADPIFVVGDCPSVPGNSGAPLLNAAGEAVGAFQAELPYTEQQRAAWGPHLLPGETFTPLALGTSLVCLNSNSWDWNPACAPIDESAIVRPRISDFPLTEEADALLAPALAELPGIFEWQRAPEGSANRALERRETLNPKCFRPAHEWIAPFAAEGGKFHEYATHARISVATPILQSEIFFNRYMQVVAKARLLSETLTQEILFNPAALVEEGSSPINESESLTYCDR